MQLFELRACIVPEDSMGGKNRKFKRFSIQQDVYFILNNVEIHCNSGNVSSGGACMIVNPQHADSISKKNMGDDIDVIIDKGEKKETIKAKIIRYSEQNSAVMVAVYFLNELIL